MKKLENKKTVITGGSRGIGKAIAEAFLREGAEVWLAARSASELQETTKVLSRLGQVRCSALDVSDRKAVARFAGEVQKIWGGVQILVNGAGVYGPIGIVSDVDPEEWLAALTVNLYGTFLMTHDFAPLMAPGSTIINFVGGGEGAYPHFSSYVAAKGGIARFTETVAAELKNKGIAVNAIAPGAVNTKLLDDLLKAGPEKSGKENYEKAMKQKNSGGVSPEKAASLCVWLASDASKGLTGKILSAVWDNFEKIPERMEDIMKSDVYTFRRVRPKDREFKWDEKL